MIRIFTLLIVLSFSCFDSFGQLLVEKIHTTNSHAEIHLPAEWEIVEYPGVEWVIRDGIVDSGSSFRSNCNLVITNPPNGMGLVEYVRLSLDQIQTLENFGLVEQSCISTDAYYLEYIHSYNDVLLHSELYVMWYRGEVYNLTFTSSEDRYSKIKPLFHTMFESFDFLK